MTGEWSDVTVMREQAREIARRAQRERVHVLLVTPDNLPVAVMAGLRAWLDHRYHLCVRLDRGKENGNKRYEHPRCHNRRFKAMPV